MKTIICCILIVFAPFATASGGDIGTPVDPKDLVTHIDPVDWEKWQWRADRAEKHLMNGQWDRADKVARNLGRDVVDGSRLGHRIEPLLARVSAIRAVSLAMRGKKRLARWHWQLAQILTSKPPDIDLGRFPSRISYLEGVKPRGPDERPAGVMSWADADQPEPKALKTPMPVYSKSTVQVGIQARMVVNVIVREDGLLSDPHVYDKGDLAVFYYPIIVALADWEFEPLIVDGQPMSFVYIMTVRFRIE